MNETFQTIEETILFWGRGVTERYWGISPYQTRKIQDEKARSVQYGSDLYCLETIISLSDREIQDENARPVQFGRKFILSGNYYLLIKQGKSKMKMHVQCSMGVIYTVWKLLSPYQTGTSKMKMHVQCSMFVIYTVWELLSPYQTGKIQDENACSVQYVGDLHCLGTIISLSDRENP